MGYQRWQSQIDKAIQEAINDGRSDHLPGTGQPLNLKSDANIPSDMRMAYKIMEEHQVLPEWIMLNKDLEKLATRIRQQLEQAARLYHDSLAKLNALPAAQSAKYRQNAEAAWKAAQGSAQALIASFNDQVLTYNLKVPPGIQHRIPMNLERELTRLDGR